MKYFMMPSGQMLEVYEPYNPIKYMIITDEKIKVTYEMMQCANMTRGDQLGVPDGRSGLYWKQIAELSDEDFDKIEQHFLQKQTAKP